MRKYSPEGISVLIWVKTPEQLFQYSFVDRLVHNATPIGTSPCEEVDVDIDQELRATINAMVQRFWSLRSANHVSRCSGKEA
jgi:hypothetical protein